MVRICEVGPRDGLQSINRVVPTRAKIELIDRLSQTGLSHIEVTSFVNPRRVPQFSDARQVALGITRQPRVVYSALVPNTHYLGLALNSGMDHIAVFISAHEEHSRANLGKSIEESVASAQSVAEVALARGAKLRVYLSAVFGYVKGGDVPLGRVNKLIKILHEMGSQEISLGDTTGLADPERVSSLLLKIMEARTIPLDRLVMHFHDGGLGLENVEAAYEMGIGSFDGSLGGIGGCPFAEGAKGNVATEDLVRMFTVRGIPTGIDQRKLSLAVSFLRAQLEDLK